MNNQQFFKKKIMMAVGFIHLRFLEILIAECILQKNWATVIPTTAQKKNDET